MLSLICNFLLLSVVLALDVSVFNGVDYAHFNGTVLERVPTYKFEYHVNDTLNMGIYLTNTSSHITAAVFVTRATGISRMEKAKTTCVKGDCFGIFEKINSTTIAIDLELYSYSTFCATYRIVTAKADDNKYDDHICINSSNCAIEIDLQNECKDINQSLLYVIPLTVIGICILLILMVYLSIKWYCRRDSNPDTMELNTYFNMNEVQYAEFGFEHGDQGGSVPTPQVEEPPYAEIIGVLKPVLEEK